MTYQAEPTAIASMTNSVPFAHTGKAITRALIHIQANTLKALIHVQIESLAFVQHRCEQDLKLIDDLVDSEKYHNTFGVYGEFVRDTVSGYANETRKLISLGTGLVSDAAKQANGEVDRVFEDVTARTITL